MEFAIQTAKLTGNPSEKGWAQVHDFTPQDSEKLKLRGRIFAVIATTLASSQPNNIAPGREILTRLHEEYYGNLAPTPFNALKEAVEKVVREFSSQEEGDVEIVAASYLDPVIYTAASSGGQAVLFRDAGLAKILVSKKGEVVSASGFPKENDILILGTGLFFQTFPQGIIKASVETQELDKAIEFLAPKTHSLEEASSLAAAFLSFKSQTQTFETLPQIKEEEKSKVPSPFSEKFAYFKARLSALFEKATSFLPQRKIYIREKIVNMEEVKNKKTILSAGIIFLILLVISIGFGARQKKIKDTKAKYETKLVEAKHNFEEAEKLISLNPARARELFILSKNATDELASQGIKDGILDELKSKIENSRGRLLGEYRSVPELFIDLTLLSSGFLGDDLALSEKEIAVLDKKGERVVVIDINTKRTEMVAGPDQIDLPKSVALYSGRTFILTDDGVHEISKTAKKVIDKFWEEEALFYAYAGNIYVLDAKASKIYRFAGIEGGFGSKQDWLAEDTRPDFSGASSLTIDGLIWVAAGTKILRFSQGAPLAFSVKGVSPQLEAIDAIFTNEKQKYLYILDKKNLRIVVLDKEGEYQAQYFSDETGKAKDIVVSEEDSKLIFLTQDGKVYSIELKHLE